MANDKSTLPAPKFWATDFFQRHAQAALVYATEQFQSDQLCEFQRWDWRTESPAESVFAIWWHVIEMNQRCSLVLVPQVSIVAGGESWRLDFQVIPTSTGCFFSELVGHPLCPRIAVELDGHDFHERTRAQVDLRNRRDRALSSEGWLVWHVSGSELNANPEQAVSTIIELAADEFWKALRMAGFYPRG